MARRTLGAFIDRSRVEAATSFFLRSWELLRTGPEILVPRHVGTWEPLKRVESVDLDRIVKGEFIFANGTRARGWVSSPTFLESRYFRITIHLKLAERDLYIADEVYEWLKQHFAYSVLYMGNPSRQLFEENLEFHQMLNSGLVEISLGRALELRHLLDRIDLAA